jgi:hypothetical protein
VEDPNSPIGPLDIDTRRLRELRSVILDLGQEIDSYKAVTAAALGGGVFLGLLGAGAIYDIVSGNASVWGAVGITGSQLKSIATLLSGLSLFLLGLAAVRILRRDRSRDARLARLEEEMADLRERSK